MTKTNFVTLKVRYKIVHVDDRSKYGISQYNVSIPFDNEKEFTTIPKKWFKAFVRGAINIVNDIEWDRVIDANRQNDEKAFKQFLCPVKVYPKHKLTSYSFSLTIRGQTKTITYERMPKSGDIISRMGEINANLGVVYDSEDLTCKITVLIPEDDDVLTKHVVCFKAARY